MITGKQRAYLRKMAHQLEPIFQIGKEGVTDAFIDGLNKALTKREIVKVHILYRKSDEEKYRKIELPRK